MSNKKTLADKLNAFIFGEPIPVLSENDLDNLQHLDDKLDLFLTLLNAPPINPDRVSSPSLDQQQQRTAQPPEPHQDGINDLTEQIRKLAKTQFKANALQEAQLAQQQEAMAGLKKSVEQQEKQVVEFSRQHQESIEQAQLTLLKELLPILDSLDAAFDNGRRQVMQLAMPSDTRQAMIAWLDGVRLARLRFLDVLQIYNINPIATIGRPFDPNHHVAVATDTTGRAADGIIISEDRRGYATPHRVLRYAEVVVTQSNNKP